MSPDAIICRPATATDWPAIEALLHAHQLPLAGAREHLAHFIVADIAGRVAGCIGLERYGADALLRSAAVADEMRGHGVGSALVHALIHQAQRSGVQRLILLTTTADGYFPRFGFSTIDRAAVPGAVKASIEFQGACPTSAVVMGLNLKPAPTG